jgi:hypothetical protein
MPTTVFISSTSRDLLEHRAAVAKALLNGGYHPIDMADFMARPEGAMAACLKEVAESDLFLGIYAWRYGFVPPDSEVSITEEEFLEAQRLGKPRFCFMVDDTYAWPDEYMEGGLSARLLRDFKARIDAELVRTIFTTPEDLAQRVLASLSRWEREQADKASEHTTRSEDDRRSGGINISGAEAVTVGNVIEGNVIGDSVSGDSWRDGDKISGDKTVTTTVGAGSTGVAIGQGATATGSQGLSGADLAALFAQIRLQIEERPEDPNVEKEELVDTVDKVEQEVVKGDQANTSKVSRWLGNLADMAPDIFEVTVATLTNPAAGVATVISKIAQKAKEEAA